MEILEKFQISKTGKLPCGDALFLGEDFVAVIDGATPKGERLWDGLPGDVFISSLLSREISLLPKDIGAAKGLMRLNASIQRAYEGEGLSYEGLAPWERLSASLILFSRYHKEVWSFGDCQYRYEGETFRNIKEVDELLGNLRSFLIRLDQVKGTEEPGRDRGREGILKLLKEQEYLANQPGPFGFKVLNGGPVDPSKIQVRRVEEGRVLILASDGYPNLYDSLEETENDLRELLKQDPECIGVLRGTKAVGENAISFDDRTYVKIRI